MRVSCLVRPHAGALGFGEGVEPPAPVRRLARASISRERRDLAMTCGRLGRHATRDNLLSGCGRFLLRDHEAAAIFDRMVSTVRAQWLPVMRGAGVDAADRDAIREAFVYDGLSASFRRTEEGR